MKLLIFIILYLSFSSQYAGYVIENNFNNKDMVYVYANIENNESVLILTTFYYIKKLNLNDSQLGNYLSLKDAISLNSLYLDSITYMRINVDTSNISLEKYIEGISIGQQYILIKESCFLYNGLLFYLYDKYNYVVIKVFDDCSVMLEKKYFNSR
jgi:hypothetical protein